MKHIPARWRQSVPAAMQATVVVLKSTATADAAPTKTPSILFRLLADGDGENVLRGVSLKATLNETDAVLVPV